MYVRKNILHMWSSGQTLEAAGKVDLQNSVGHDLEQPNITLKSANHLLSGRSCPK